MESPKKYLCKQCNAKLSHPSALKRHVLSKHDKSRHGCDQCKKQFVRLDALQRHKLEQHSKNQSTSEERGTTCSKCHRDFSRVAYKVDHEKRCSKRRVYDRGLSGSPDQPMPIAEHTSDGRARTQSYTCTYYRCGQRFDSHADLRGHERVVHQALPRHLAIDPPTLSGGSMQVLQWQNQNYFALNAITNYGSNVGADQSQAKRRARFVPFVLPVPELSTGEMMHAFNEAFWCNNLSDVKLVLRRAKKNSGLDIDTFCSEFECWAGESLDYLFSEYTTTELFLEDLFTFLLALKPNQGTILLSHAFGFACRHANELALRVFPKAKRVNVNCKDHNCNTPLMNAVEAKCEALVKALLDADGIEINAVDWLGRTALMLAVKSRSTEIVDALLGADKIDLNIQNENGWTALMQAVSECSIEIVKALLRTTKVDLNIQNDGGYTALMIAVERRSTEIVGALLRTDKVDINIQNGAGYTALLLAVIERSTEIVDALLRADKVDLNIQDEYNWTAIMIAIARGYREIVKALLRTTKVDINIQGKTGWTALMIAVENNSTEIVEALLRTTKVDINIQEKHGWTAIMIAILNGCPIKLVNALLDNDDIDIDIKDNNGRTVIDIALSEASSAEIVEALWTYQNKSSMNL